MSRSVSTHRNALATVYLRPEIEDHDNPYAWSDFLDDLRNILTGEAGVDSKLLLNGKPFTGFQGYKSADRWSGREDQIILEGELSEVSVSEYGGMVSVCLAPLDPDDKHHVTACHNAAPYFLAILLAAYPDCCFARLGTFSNGESVYKALDA
jgi:hypothetical protein